MAENERIFHFVYGLLPVILNSEFCIFNSLNRRHFPDGAAGFGGGALSADGGLHGPVEEADVGGDPPGDLLGVGGRGLSVRREARAEGFREASGREHIDGGGEVFLGAAAALLDDPGAEEGLDAGEELGRLGAEGDGELSGRAVLGGGGVEAEELQRVAETLKGQADRIWGGYQLSSSLLSREKQSVLREVTEGDEPKKIAFRHDMDTDLLAVKLCIIFEEIAKQMD